MDINNEKLLRFCGRKELLKTSKGKNLVTCCGTNSRVPFAINMTQNFSNVSEGHKKLWP